MSTQNLHQPPRYVFTAGPAAGSYYGPIFSGAGVVGDLQFSATSANAYINMDGYDHLSIQGYVTAVGAATAILTVESDDGVTMTFLWPETLGAYDSTTNTYNAAYVGTGGVNTYFHLHLDDCGGRLFHVKLVNTDATGAAVLTFRQTKV
jgi:hypothetical protein